MLCEFLKAKKKESPPFFHCSEFTAEVSGTAAFNLALGLLTHISTIVLVVGYTHAHIFKGKILG